MSSYGNQNNGAAQQYLRQQIEQAGPVEQVLMLYDGILKFMTLAKDSIARGDIEGRYNANRRAMEIIAYLIDMVNPESGGDAGKKLFGIYSALLKRMLQVDFENNPVVCEDIITNVRALRIAMAQALAVSMAQKKSAEVVAPASGTVVAAPSSSDGLPPVLRRGAVA